MKIDTDCVGCIVAQSERVLDAINADDSLRNTIRLHVKQSAPHFDFTLSPPEVATELYEDMARLADMPDLYAKQKQYATKRAKAFMEPMRRIIASATDPLETLLKVAVAGNVIDLAAEVSFDLDEELDKIFHTDFSVDHVDALRHQLHRARTLLYIGDNVGEHLFDYLAIEALQQRYSALHVSYMVRGNPIINDVTLNEARQAGFEQLCTLVDSGVNTPGFVYERATPEAKRLFDTADIVITKGMGNYECLSPAPRENLLYLLKVKCSVVAASLEREIGDIICKMA